MPRRRSEEVEDVVVVVGDVPAAAVVAADVDSRSCAEILPRPVPDDDPRRGSDTYQDSVEPERTKKRWRFFFRSHPDRSVPDSTDLGDLGDVDSALPVLARSTAPSATRASAHPATRTYSRSTANDMSTRVLSLNSDS